MYITSQFSTESVCGKKEQIILVLVEAIVVITLTCYHLENTLHCNDCLEHARTPLINTLFFIINKKHVYIYD